MTTVTLNNPQAFRKMINFMYGKENIRTGTTLEEIFEVAFLATKYNTVELMDIVVAQCRSLHLMGSDFLDATPDAERFQDHFPKAAEAVIENCTSELLWRLTTSEDFIQFASQHSSDQAKSGTAFRLMARLQAPPNEERQKRVSKNCQRRSQCLTKSRQISVKPAPTITRHPVSAATQSGTSQK